MTLAHSPQSEGAVVTSTGADASAAELADRAICPNCHTTDSVTMTAVSAGATWKCARCQQQWNARRLVAVAAYTAWMASRSGATAVTPSSPLEFNVHAYQTAS